MSKIPSFLVFGVIFSAHFLKNVFFEKEHMLLLVLDTKTHFCRTKKAGRNQPFCYCTMIYHTIYCGILFYQLLIKVSI